ncbi:MAG: ribosome-associated translation inhibitor RaiA [Ruminococcus sp.]|jgi:putative sigma-54 modulation protein|nr:ribosome-associated translation inhibitor RaiA [Ruminococcus sp.]
MKITYTARKVNLKDNFKERVEKKLLKFERVFSEDAAVNVVVTLEKNRQTVEITVNDNGMIYRAESTMPEMNDAVDKVVDILARQIRKNKTKLAKKIKSAGIEDLIMQTPDIEVEDDTEYNIVRKKNVIVKPTTVDEAILEMNMVGHDFYMFMNADTGEMNVVYKRADGDYGLIEPSVE